MADITGYNDSDNYAPFENENDLIPAELAPLISKNTIKPFNNTNTYTSIESINCTNIKPFQFNNKDNLELYNELPYNYNKKIFDTYRYVTKKNAQPQYLDYIDKNDEVLLIKYLPIIYTDKNDCFKFINPNYYLEFTEVLFDNKIIGYKKIIDDKTYLCYNIFYEKNRNISSSKSDLSGRIVNQYAGQLFSVILICIELTITNDSINNIVLSSDLDNKSNYQIIKPLNTISSRIKIFISKDKHNLYLLNETINDYKNYITNNNEKCDQAIEMMFSFEPILSSKNNQNIIKYDEIQNIDTIIVSKPYTKSIWKTPKFKFIPLWFYKILPNFLSKFMFNYKS